MELIDRRKLISDFWKVVEDCTILSYEDTDDLMEKAPTVDAVEVVRCKDCKFYKDSPMGGKGCHTHFNGRTEFIPKNDNDFCSYGRKKIDEQKDC